MVSGEECGLLGQEARKLLKDLQERKEMTAGEGFRARLFFWQPEKPAALEIMADLPELIREAYKGAGKVLMDSYTAWGACFVVALSPRPVEITRNVCCWLSSRLLMEACGQSLGQAGQVFIGPECTRLDALADSLAQVRDLNDWWGAASAIPPQETRVHRKRLQTYIKKGQYTYIPGYLSRVLKEKQDIFRESWSFVPLTLEAVWAHNESLPLSVLMEGLNDGEMCRRPFQALMDWANWVCLSMKSLETGPEPIKRVLESIRRDCSLPYSQSNLAQSLGLTPAYFCRLFKEKTGYHFTEYLTMARMDRAMEMWRKDPGLPLEAVSQASGYANKSYFCQVFKKQTGMKPGEYQQSMLEELKK